MIKTVKVEDLVKYARSCAEESESVILSEKMRREYLMRAEGIRAFLATEEANRKYKPGKDMEWVKYLDKAWEEYDNMIFDSIRRRIYE